MSRLHRRARRWRAAGLLGAMAILVTGCARSWRERGLERATAMPTDTAAVASSPEASPSVPRATATPALVARVNGQPILLSEFYGRLEELRVEQADQAIPTAPVGPEEASSEAGQQVLNELIDLLLVRQAAAEMGIMPSGLEVDAQVEAAIVTGGGESAFDEWLRATGQTEQQYWLSVRDSLALQRLVLEVTGDSGAGVPEHAHAARAAAFAEWLSERRESANVELWVRQ
ncbi:MAG TPA: SurA N-terminal domain-containing protein [Anaerolineae bacterium]|nr:SurA N-terminal domain-containing protein [Anaerolineae bacterium]